MRFDAGEWLVEIHELTEWTYAAVAEKLGISMGLRQSDLVRG